MTTTNEMTAATQADLDAINALMLADPYELTDADIEEAESVDVATASIANYVPEGQYIVCLTLMPGKTKDEIQQKYPELTAKEQWDKSDFFLDVTSGKAIKRRATYTVQVEIIYDVDGDKAVSKKFDERFFVISRNPNGKTGYGKVVDVTRTKFARVCRSAWQAAYQLTDKEMQAAIDEGLTDAEMLANLSNVYMLVSLKVESRSMKSKDGGEDRIFENNVLNVYTMQPIPEELAEQLGG